MQEEIYTKRYCVHVLTEHLCSLDYLYGILVLLLSTDWAKNFTLCACILQICFAGPTFVFKFVVGIDSGL